MTSISDLCWGTGKIRNGAAGSGSRQKNPFCDIEKARLHNVTGPYLHIYVVFLHGIVHTRKHNKPQEEASFF